MFGRKKENGLARETVTLKIDGMHCEACVRRATTALQTVPGVEVKQVEVGAATILRDPGAADDKAIIESLRSAGYDARRES